MLTSRSYTGRGDVRRDYLPADSLKPLPGPGTPRGERGRTIARLLIWIVLAPVFVVALAIGGCEARKAYYDWWVQKLCEKDGGIAVYEHVKIKREVYERLGGKYGTIGVPLRGDATSAFPYYMESHDSNLRMSNPEVRRSEYQIRHKSDDRILGRAVFYSRVGGDFPSPANASHFSCPVTRKAVEEEIFEVEGDQK